MATINVLSEAEIKQAKAKGTDPALIAPYVPTLQEAAVGAWLSVKLDEGEEARTVKRRMSLAATSVGKTITWKRDRGDGTIVGEVKVPAAPAASAPASAEAKAPDKQPATTRA